LRVFLNKEFKKKIMETGFEPISTDGMNILKKSTKGETGPLYVSLTANILKCVCVCVF